ncbi:MAG: helix-hairpin-helix domain-containing protein [Akkermansiaceae bacterium]|nr:helix-hairpin-helix domain-containing protein [Akkermansiaceae bacterium]
MKSTIIALLSLSALALSPVCAAPAKSAPSDRKAATKSSANSATKDQLTPGQAGARTLVDKLTPTQKSTMLNLLNKGTAQQLASIKGVSRTRAAAIEKARPFATIDEVILVNGIGKGTMSEIVSHARSLTSNKEKPSSSRAASKKKKS